MAITPAAMRPAGASVDSQGCLVTKRAGANPGLTKAATKQLAKATMVRSGSLATHRMLGIPLMPGVTRPWPSMAAARARQPSERNNGEASRAFAAASEAITATASAQEAIPLTTIRWKVVETKSTSSWGATRRSTSMSSGVPRRAATATTNLCGLDE